MLIPDFKTFFTGILITFPDGYKPRYKHGIVCSIAQNRPVLHTTKTRTITVKINRPLLFLLTPWLVRLAEQCFMVSG